jgi:phosphatidylserine/phosphatidylglycerophosphate/cardiolipin synthase-like enzyme
MGLRRLALAALMLLTGGARAAVPGPQFELVYTTPVETALVNADLRDPVTVWSEMFDRARKEIVIGQFYAVHQAGTPFDKVLERLAAAGKRGVKIRFLLDEKGLRISGADTIALLRAIPNLELRIIDFGKLTGGGIIHAKYLAVDGREAFVGSQNFDWRAFTHIQETGLRITEPRMVAQVMAVFEQDWQAQAALAAGREIAGPAAAAQPDLNHGAVLLASPRALNPPGVADSETALPALLAAAKNEVRVQLLDYVPLAYGTGGVRPYYAVIDNAVRTAAARGVKIKLMVSHWSTDKPAISYLKSLALVPNVEIRIVTIPPASSGPIPFARVIHSKTMSIDGQLAWVGTSNWAGGYFDNSRNLEVVVRDQALAQRLGALHEQAWTSQYAQPLDINRDYPKPNKEAK